MKLLKLELLNLASLDRSEGEVINFEEGALKDCTIFSIVGSTGSGKSTILDAICLALYNRAPRYPRQKGDRSKIEVYGDPDETEKNRLAPTDGRNILTRGKKSGYSKLTFLANNGTVYRAEWSVSMATKNYKDTVTALYSISNINGNIVETVQDWNQLPTIIGLDYDQFLRTVLIAQGTFSHFLNAKEEERYALLEKLIGNEDLYESITAAIKKNKEIVDEVFTKINSDFAAFEKDLIDNKEELKALAERIKAHEEAEKEDKKELQLIAEALGWYVAEKKFNENITQYEADYLRAKERLDSNKAAAERLLLHDTTLPAVDLYKETLAAKADIENTESNLAKLNEKLANSVNSLKEREGELATLKEAEQKAKEDQQAQSPHIARARILLGEIAIQEKTAKDLGEAYKNSSKAAEEAEKALKDNEETIVAKKEELQEKQITHDSLQIAICKQTSELEAAEKEAREKFEEENKKIEGAGPEKLQSEKSAADKQLADLKDALRITKDLLDNNAQTAAIKKELSDLEARNQEIENELSTFTIDKLSSELEVMTKSYTLMTSESWNLHRKDLEEGQACPLCGSTHHPYKDDENLEPVIGDLSRLISQKKLELKTQETSKSELEKEKSSNGGKIGACLATTTKLNNTISALEANWGKLKTDHPDWEQDTNYLECEIQAAQERSDEAEKRLREYNNLLKTVNNARTEMDGAKNALEKYKSDSNQELSKVKELVIEADKSLTAETAKTENLSKQLTTKKEEEKKAEENLQHALTQLDAKKFALKSEIGDNDPDALEKKLSEAVKAAESAVKNMEDTIGKLREAKKETEGMIEGAAKHLASAQEKSITKTQELNAWLANYNSQEGASTLTIGHIAQLHSSTENWEQIRSEQKKLDSEHTISHTTLTNERNAHQAHQQSKPEKTEEELSARQAELSTKSNTEYVEDTARMQRHEAAEKKMSGLTEEREKAKQAKEDWDQIYAAIGGDGKTLRKIAQCYTLRFLIEHANAEIRKFNNRYELVQVKNSLGIRVIDHDRADDIRDTTSLSGGETFIVSLGLALGLSALSSRNISFENLFIDEGFGTLDPDTLEIVIDSLAMLQSSQGKKVGVISHTDTMSDRITTKICVVKKGNSGSSEIKILP